MDAPGQKSVAIGAQERGDGVRFHHPQGLDGQRLLRNRLGISGHDRSRRLDRETIPPPRRPADVAVGDEAHLFRLDPPVAGVLGDDAEAAPAQGYLFEHLVNAGPRREPGRAPQRDHEIGHPKQAAPQGAAGMVAVKLLDRKTAQTEAGHQEGVANREGRCGRGRRSETAHAGFLLDAGFDDPVHERRERAVPSPGHARRGDAELLDRRHHGDQFLGIARMAEHDHQGPVLGDPQVPMQSIGGMDEGRPMTGREQAGGEFLPDHSRLADPEDNRKAVLTGQRANGPSEGRPQAGGGRPQAPRPGVEDLRPRGNDRFIGSFGHADSWLPRQSTPALSCQALGVVGCLGRATKPAFRHEFSRAA